MKYERPIELDENQISEILIDRRAVFNRKVVALLSSIYYSTNDRLPGDRLIEEFKKASFKEKLSLISLVETYYGMRMTTYRIDEFINEMKIFLGQYPEKKAVIDYSIETLRQYKART